MKVMCDYCGRQARFIDSSFIYGRSYGMIYYCPDCKAWVGVHKGTDIPLGRLADAKLRKAKMAAHAAFDVIWRHRRTTRKSAYKWLSEQMGLPVEKTHIGMFDIAQCEQVIALCKKRMEEMPNGQKVSPLQEVSSSCSLS